VTVRTPTWDLCSDLRIARDSELGDTENVRSAYNRTLRLYVAGWMLHDDARAALELYEGCGVELLDRPGLLTTASIACEVVQMLDGGGR
jgi:hypothetical protein